MGSADGIEKGIQKDAGIVAKNRREKTKKQTCACFFVDLGTEPARVYFGAGFLPLVFFFAAMMEVSNKINQKMFSDHIAIEVYARSCVQ